MSDNDKKRKLYIVAGPTGIGKTKYSIELAKRIDGEIVSLDSIQVYIGLDIGSGKIKKDEMEGITHYMISEIPPTSSFNIKDFKDMAMKYIDKIYSHGKTPILVGGTGFYINAILYDTSFIEEDEEKVMEIREKLCDIVEKKGIDYIYEKLREVDPVSCDIIHKNNEKRVIRAYEFYLLHDIPISKHNAIEKAKESIYDYEFYVLDMDRDVLYDRINKRVDAMINDGLIQEIDILISSGVTKDMQSMQAIGYKELYDYVHDKKDDEQELKKIIDDIKMHTRQYAKRQITWFKSQQNIKYIRV